VKRLATQSLVLHCQPCDLFHHFCRSCIFHPLRRGPSFSRCCIFQPCELVRHFPGPAFSSSANWTVIFQVLHCPGPAFSVAPFLTFFFYFLNVYYNYGYDDAGQSILSPECAPTNVLLRSS